MMADSNMNYSTSQYVYVGNQHYDHIFDGPNTHELPVPLSNQKQRILYSNAQKKILEAEFAKNSSLKRLNYFSLSNKLGVSEKQVRVWFQNRRAKEKKIKMKNSMNPTKNSDHILQSSKDQRQDEQEQQSSRENNIDANQKQNQYQWQRQHQWLDNYQCQYQNQEQNQQSRQDQHLWQAQHLHQDHHQQQNPFQQHNFHQNQNQHQLPHNQEQQIQENLSWYEDETVNEYHQGLPEYQKMQQQLQRHNQIQQDQSLYNETFSEYQLKFPQYSNKQQQHQHQYQVQQQAQQHQLWYEETNNKYQQVNLNKQQQYHHQYQILPQVQQLNHHMDLNVTSIDSSCQ